MKTHLKHPRWLLVGVAGFALAACGTEGTTSDDYAEAIPSASTVELALEEDDGGALTSDSALEGDPSTFRERAREIVERVNAAIRTTHERIDEITSSVEPTELELRRLSCKQWETTIDEGLDVRVRSCLLDRRAKRFVYSLEARAAESDDDAAYLPIVGGRGIKLPRFEGERRGVGQVGYNFDNLASLLGEGLVGKVGVGYRHAGRARQLDLGLLQFGVMGSTDLLNARFHFMHVLGRGGFLRHIRFGDFLTRDESDHLIGGADGLKEVGRIALAWSRSGAARVVAAACGGTVGEGECVRVVQCYQASGAVSYEDVAAESAAITWDEAACPEVPMPPMGAPGEGEVGAPPAGSDADVPGPSMEEPPALPDFE